MPDLAWEKARKLLKRLIVQERLIATDPFIHPVRLIDLKWLEMEKRITSLNVNRILCINVTIGHDREEDRADPVDLEGLVEDQIEMKMAPMKVKAGTTQAGQVDIGIPTIEPQKKTEKCEESSGHCQLSR